MAENLRRVYEKSTVDLSLVKELLQAGEKYAVLIHRHPDGDAVCSGVAVARVLRALGKTARICCADEVPAYLQALCPETVETDPCFSDDEILVSVDVAESMLFGSLAERIAKQGVYLKLDHHRTGSDFAKYNMVDPDASAAGEIVYRLALSLGITDTETMLACYGAIASDTGGFRYANATAGAFEAAGAMRKMGLCFEDVNSVLFESKDYRTLAATSYGVGKTVFRFDGKVAVFAVSRAEMDEMGFEDENLSELPSALREIRGVHMSVVMREEKERGHYRISTRSDKYGDCIALCSAFGGGGHLRAAGATIAADDKESAIAAVLQELAKQFAG